HRLLVYSAPLDDHADCPDGQRRDYRTYRYFREMPTGPRPYLGRGPQILFESADQLFNIKMETRVADFCRIASSERLQDLRQLFLLGHLGISHQQRNYSSVRLECRRNLHPYYVVRFV